jgi:hypothetical protein
MASSMAKVCVFAPFLLLAGCSAFFEFNLLKGLDKPAAPKASDYEGSSGLDKLASDLGSRAVVAQLAADPTTTQQIETYLSTTYLAGPLTTPDQQEAAALYSDLNLKTTLGDQFVNNVVNLVISGASGGKSVKEILQGIVPPSAASDPTVFAAMIEGLLNAYYSYILLGNSIPPAPLNVNIGDVAQKAAVALTIRVAMTEIETTLSLADSAADRATAEDQMYRLTNNQSNSISGVTVSDPFNPAPAWLQNIFTAAGATMPS